MPDTSASWLAPPVPVFRVRDVDASISYYCNTLGFQLRWRAAADFACVARGHCTFFLTSDHQSQPRMWVWIGVPDVRALHEELVAAGASIRNPPNNYEWAMEIQVEDLDGNVLRIGSDPDPKQPLGIWRDGDGVRWQRFNDGRSERVE